MNKILQFILIGVTFLFCIFILVVTQKKKLSYKYTLLWLFFGFVTLLCAIFPLIKENEILAEKIERLEKKKKDEENMKNENN